MGARIEPAVGCARDGVPVSPVLARAIAAERQVIAADPGLRDVLAGRLRAGGTLRQPALARTLAALRDGGPGVLYRGEVGARLVAGLRALGSPLAAADLAAHATELTAPLGGDYAGSRC